MKLIVHLLLISGCLLFTSCSMSMTKRVHRKGYHINIESTPASDRPVRIERPRPAKKQIDSLPQLVHSDPSFNVHIASPANLHAAVPAFRKPTKKIEQLPAFPAMGSVKLKKGSFSSANVHQAFARAADWVWYVIAGLAIIWLVKIISGTFKFFIHILIIAALALFILKVTGVL